MSDNIERYHIRTRRRGYPSEVSAFCWGEHPDYQEDVLDMPFPSRDVPLVGFGAEIMLIYRNGSPRYVSADEMIYVGRGRHRHVRVMAKTKFDRMYERVY